MNCPRCGNPFTNGGFCRTPGCPMYFEGPAPRPKPTLHENLRKHLLNVALAANKLRLYRTVMQARGHLIACKAREGLGLTQREMAKRLGIDHTYLSRIENDKTQLTVPLAEAILAMVDGQDAAKAKAETVNA